MFDLQMTFCYRPQRKSKSESSFDITDKNDNQDIFPMFQIVSLKHALSGNIMEHPRARIILCAGHGLRAD